MSERKSYAEIVKARRDLPLGEEYEGRYETLRKAGLDGFWVSPPQKISRSRSGPVLVAHNFLDFERAKQYKDCILDAGGYLPCMPFNGILDCALIMAGMNRSNIYITQALHFLPKDKNQNTHKRLLRRSFHKVTQFEIRDRRVIALGREAKEMCLEWHSKHNDFELIYCLDHPSARGGDPCAKAEELAKALKKADGR